MPFPPVIRKAAILVSCLERAQADALLEAMPEEQARRVREAMLSLEEIDVDERDEVIQEFVHRGGPAPAMRNDRGVELDGGLASRLAYDGAAPFAGHDSRLDPDRRPFEFLLQADGDRLSAFLRDERPQTVALVLSYLPTDLSARIAASLPQPLQSDVLRKLGDLDEASPDALREVEVALRERIERDERNRARRNAGLEIVSRIMDAAEPQLAEQWRAAVADETLSEEPAPTPALTWAEFERWDAHRAVAAVLATPPETSVLALAGATPGFFARLLTAMHPADAEFFRRATSQLSLTRLSDIEVAQQRLAADAALVSNVPAHAVARAA
jgi:flagellar motor switch protein FliG